ncbi:MAG: hypothetical protein AVDCRST_MAG38-966, partial [uncultured Solirubrobacteraceae bacterium]
VRGAAPPGRSRSDAPARHGGSRLVDRDHPAAVDGDERSCRASVL